MSDHEDFVLVSPRSKYAVHSSGISEKVRVGSEYQADIPDCMTSSVNRTEVELRGEKEHDDLRMWTPIPDDLEAKVQAFLRLATSKHGYSLEQAHGLLFWHKCNTDEALLDLTAYTPAPSEWNNEEKEIFSKSAKLSRSREDDSPNIEEIHKDLPHKSIKSLVDFYYKWQGDNLRQSWIKKCSFPASGSLLESAPKRYRIDSPNVRNGITRFIS